MSLFGIMSDRDVEEPEQLGKIQSAQTWTFSFGGVSVRLTPDADVRIAMSEPLEDFLISSPNCDLEMTVKWAGGIQEPTRPCEFDSGSLWRFHRTGNDNWFYFATSILGSEPYKCIHLDPSLNVGEIFMNREYFPPESAVHPLEYPADELLLIHKLASVGGVEVHGCGVVDASGTGNLFLGQSGAGKSTMARLWSATEPAVSILSDDRIIVRKIAGRVMMFGTPWHGDAGFASPRSAQLNRIFILQHGPENRIQRLQPSIAAAEIFARSFVPFHTHASVDAALAVLDDLVHQVECYRFSFLPHESSVKHIIDFDNCKSEV